MSHRRSIILVLPLALLLVLSAGCAAGAGAADIEGDWRLVSATSGPANMGSAGITANFKDGQLGGSGGVNSYGAPYEVGSGGSLTIGDVTSTLMAGSDEANAAEAAYFGLLREVASFLVANDTLTLKDDTGNDLLVFERAK